MFATPGMLHAGLSLQIFKKWADDEKNMVSYDNIIIMMITPWLLNNPYGLVHPVMGQI